MPLLYLRFQAFPGGAILARPSGADNPLCRRPVPAPSPCCAAPSRVLKTGRFPGGLSAADRTAAPCRKARHFRHFRRSPLSSWSKRGSFTVASKTAGATGLGERYATALYELADEQKTLDSVAADLRALRELIDESADLRRLIRSPVLSRAEQGKAIAALAERAGLQPLVRNILGLMAKNRRLFVVPDVIKSFLAELAKRRGEVTAEVVSAQPLSDAQRQSLDERLRRAVGGKVAIETRVDPSLLGGLIVRLGSRMVDASLSSKLQRLQLAMKGVR
ncbi:MAG TPA: F0F1 ATP synthase subunit delta [Stellaceae bacterium]|nr:F0F1 ATP synthase subunit delta [Stellaceae bacterium]